MLRARKKRRKIKTDCQTNHSQTTDISTAHLSPCKYSHGCRRLHAHKHEHSEYPPPPNTHTPSHPISRRTLTHVQPPHGQGCRVRYVPEREKRVEKGRGWLHADQSPPVYLPGCQSARLHTTLLPSVSSSPSSSLATLQPSCR